MTRTRVARAAGATAVVTGAVVLLGWALDVRALRSILPIWASMKPNTAAGFILEGTALWLLRGDTPGTRRIRVARLCAAIALLVGLLTMVEYVAGWDLRIDRLLLPATASDTLVLFPGRMGPNTALSFMLLGAGLLGVDAATARRRRWAEAATAMALAIAFTGTLGYLYAVTPFSQVTAYTTQMALHTALLFFILSLGILVARADGWVLRAITSEGTGSLAARRLLPVVVVIPVLVGWLQLKAQHAGLISTEFGVAIVVLTCVIILAIAVLTSAVSINRADTRRRGIELALRRSNAELEHFAYVASHDLQEPLRMVGSYVELLAKRYRGKLDRDADDFIDFALDGASRMRKMIEDLLAFSRVGSRGGAMIAADSGMVLRGVLSDLKMAIAEAGASVAYDGLPMVRADPGQLEHVFLNLLTNAVKFRGAEPPRIHVSAERDGPQWTFRVRDNGIGIDPRYFERIFVIFQRLHGRDQYPGTGIGLAITKKIVERHGGRIWVESTAGMGSTFCFTLPMVEQKSA